MKKIIAVLSLVSLVSRAAEDAWFPFPVSVFSDDVPVFDCSWLNEKPAGTSGWLKVDGERITDAKGKTVRLVGANITAKGNFPEPKEAAAIARHLAQYGVNVLRLHFLDNQWGGMSLVPKSNDVAKDGLETNALARLDAFVAAMKAEGIYVNLNLHVGRSYPGDEAKLTQNSKGIGNFMPGMIAALKDYSRLLLEHVNPHTGLAYKNDPAIAVIEITNEDSLLLNPWWIEQLSGAPKDELARQWNVWLRKKYADTAALQKSWGVFTGYIGENVYPSDSVAKWNAEKHQGAESSLREMPDGTARWLGIKPGAQTWNIQLSSPGIKLTDGQRYEVKFRIRSPTKNHVTLNASTAGGDYKQLGFSKDFAAGDDWREVVEFMTPGGVSTQYPARLVFSLQNKTGVVEIANFTCRPVSTGYLQPNQTFEAGPLPLPKQGDPVAVRGDFFRFLADTEVAFANDVIKFLKHDLGCKALIAHSQVLFGGPVGARREFLVSDFVDTHGYWHHPSWPRRQWDPRDWNIVNESQIKSWDGGTLAEMAMQRPAGKPYTISEYDIPAPNDHQAELWPMLGAFAAFQDWSALYQYTLTHDDRDWHDTKIHGYFNAIGNPAKDAMRPIGTLIFRLGLVQPAQHRVALRLNDATVFDLATRQNGQMWGTWRDLWTREAKLNGALALLHRTALVIAPDAPASAVTGNPPPALKPPYTSDTGEWNWNTDTGIFLLQAPAARIWSGEIGGADLAAGDTTLSTAALDAPSPRATAVLLALDGQPIAQSKKLLLTALRRVENEGMKWNEQRTSVSDQWGGGPAKILGYHAKLTLPPGTKWKIETLTSTGTIKEKISDAATEVAITPQHQTMWWLLTR